MAFHEELYTLMYAGVQASPRSQSAAANRRSSAAASRPDVKKRPNDDVCFYAFWQIFLLFAVKLKLTDSDLMVIWISYG